MKSEQKPQAFLRKRKMMLVLPIIAVPFITMAFWALGGGRGNAANQTAAVKPGLNLHLPNAKLKDEGRIDKLGFYEKAEKDSSDLEEWMRNDPYYTQRADSLNYQPSGLEQITQTTAGKYNQRLNLSPYENTGNNPEQKLLQKLALLQNEINKQSPDTNNEPGGYTAPAGDKEFAGHVTRLQDMMQQVGTPPEADPEISQLNGTLDKIIDIQHPERVKNQLMEKEEKRKGAVYPVSQKKAMPTVSLLDTGTDPVNSHAVFFGIEEPLAATEENSVAAVVHETQTLVNGSIIKLRLLDDIYILGTIIPKGSFVSGFVSLNDERLTVEINSVKSRQSVFPVKLEAYDMDGLAGIYIPGAIARDVAKESADNSLQLAELSSMDPSFKAQATAAGINTAKSLLSRKVKLIKVTVKAGYRVLLRDKALQQ